MVVPFAAADVGGTHYSFRKRRIARHRRRRNTNGRRYLPSRAATVLTTIARMTAPKRYESNA